MMATLKQRLESFRFESRPRLVPKRDKVSLSPLKNRSEFQALSKKKIKVKIGKKIGYFPKFFFSPHDHLFPLFLRRAFIVVAATSHTSDFLAPLGMPPTPFLL
jgi:hypothetical protein